MTSPTSPAERSSLRDHPIGFWFFFWGEFAERSCFYGMRAILLLYMTQVLKFTDGTANQVQSYFIAACYLLPLLGGYVADNYLGKYRTIVYFAVPYIIGQLLLGISSLHKPEYLFLSLGLLAMGSGVIKPNISTLMGLTYDQQRPGWSKLRSDAFALFYGSINIGAALTSFGVPWIRNYYGSDSHAYAIAFLFPAVLMILAFIVFAAGKPFYAKETIQRVRPTPAERHQRIVILRRLFGLFFVVMIFWSLFDQSSFVWTLFARDHLQLRLLGYQLSPDQLQTVNPVLIILLLPPITMLWHLLARFGLNLRPTDKMLIGFTLTTITMWITVWAAFRGADAMLAGGSAALAGAEKTAVAAAVELVHDPAADKAGLGLIEAAAARRAAKEELDGAKADPAVQAAKAAVETSKAAMKAALQSAQTAGPKKVAVATARRAATASIHVAKAVTDLAQNTAMDKNSADSGEVIKVAKALIEAAQAKAEATEEAVKLATSAAEDKEKESPDSTQPQVKFDLGDCSMAAIRATTAAAAAGKSTKAAAAGNARAARLNAAVAAVNSADSAVAVARAAADINDSPRPPAIFETEEATAAARISMLWQVIPYILITMAEICISVVGLELAFAAAPAAMKSFVTACWLLTVFFGDILNAQVTPLYNETFWGISLTPDWYFLFFATLMIPVTLAFVIVSRRFNRSA
jgi:dipeptide/tripeptide permease